MESFVQIDFSYLVYKRNGKFFEDRGAKERKTGGVVHLRRGF